MPRFAQHDRRGGIKSRISITGHQAKAPVACPLGRITGSVEGARRNVLLGIHTKRGREQGKRNGGNCMRQKRWGRALVPAPRSVNPLQKELRLSGEAL